MRTLNDLSQALESQRKRLRLDYAQLANDVGLSPLAVRQALQGKAAARITNVMALADRLGLEVILVPKMLAASLQAQASELEAPAPVATSVDQAIAQSSIAGSSGSRS